MVYAPNHVIVLDESIIEQVNVFDGIKSLGWVVMNSALPPEKLRHYLPTNGSELVIRLATIDASGIASRLGLGSKQFPVVNTAILGAFARATKSESELGLVRIESIVAAVREYAPRRIEENAQAALEAFGQLIIEHEQVEI